uniref:AIPP2-like SPOC-like domain-containing protein n=1 Tax=Solanum tuberosum TaxID=4113 RepID=M1DEU2_SOLTU
MGRPSYHIHSVLSLHSHRVVHSNIITHELDAIGLPTQVAPPTWQVSHEAKATPRAVKWLVKGSLGLGTFGGTLPHQPRVASQLVVATTGHEDPHGHATALTKSPSLNSSLGCAMIARRMKSLERRIRGCYNIWNNKYNLDGVVAHISDKASQSVSEKAKLLQLHLHFEMVSKDDLWPKYFKTPEATIDDIELFFFPSEAR